MKTAEQCYGTFGLSINASDEEVKTVYREMVKQYHPDKNSAPEAREKFIEIQQAYESIVNKNFASNRQHVNMEDLFSQFGGFDFGPFANSIVHAGRNQDRSFSMSISFIEACLGVTKTISYTYQSACKGCEEHSKQHGKINVFSCSQCSGLGFLRRNVGPVSISQPCGSCAGVGTMLKCETCKGQGAVPDKKQISFKINPGMEDGSVVKFFSQGDFNYKTNLYGNVFVKLSITPHPTITRNGVDVFSRLKVPYLDCILGCDVEFESIHGIDKINIPPLTEAGAIVKKSNVGINNVGGHFLTIDVEMPKLINNTEKKLLNKIRNLKLKN